MAAANRVLATAAAAEVQPQAAAVAVEAAPPPPPNKAADSAPPEPKAPTKLLVRDKKTGKLTGKIESLIKRNKRCILGKNLNIDQRKVQVDIYQKRAEDRPDPTKNKRLGHIKTVLWSLREYRARFDIPVESAAVRTRVLDRRQLEFPLQVQLYGGGNCATLDFVANDDLSENPRTLGIFTVNTDASTYRDDLYRAAHSGPPTGAGATPTSTSGPTAAPIATAPRERARAKENATNRCGLGPRGPMV